MSEMASHRVPRYFHCMLWESSGVWQIKVLVILNIKIPVHVTACQAESLAIISGGILFGNPTERIFTYSKAGAKWEGGQIFLIIPLDSGQSRQTQNNNRTRVNAKEWPSLVLLAVFGHSQVLFPCSFCYTWVPYRIL